MQQVSKIVISERLDQIKLLFMNCIEQEIKALDVEVIDLINSDGVVDDIERADEF